MLGGYKMMFLRKKNKYEQLFIFLETYFHYELVEKNDKKESFFSKYYFIKKSFPDIQVIIEKDILGIDIKIDNSFWGIPNVYKYLHHDKIVRCRYSSYKDLIENFENDNKKYLNEIFQNIDKISNDKLENFYKEFPQYVFVWG